MNIVSRFPPLHTLAAVAVGVLFVSSPASARQDAGGKLANQAQVLLQKYCLQCHGDDKPKRGLKVLDHEMLLTKENKKKRKMVVPGKPDDSELLRRMLDSSDPMPPEGEERPTDEEVKVLRDWVAAGAPRFVATGGPPVVGVATGGPPVAAATTVAAEAKAILQKNCQDCHGGRFTYVGLKVLDFPALLKDGQVIPGKPDESPLFQRIAAKDSSIMPKKPNPRLRPEEIAVVRQWIAAGAGTPPLDVALPGPGPGPAAGAEPLAPEGEKVLQEAVGVRYVLDKVLADVRKQPRKDVPFQRYFTLTHLLTRGSTRQELDTYRDALAVTLNHLSWQRDLVKPRVVDEPTGTIFRVDIRDLGWDRRPYEVVKDGKRLGSGRLTLHDLVLLEYPYAIMYQGRTYEQLAGEFLVPAGQVRPIPYVRADWFISTATRPPLYHDLMQLPFQALRAGMTVSGVSRNNRVVERHPLPRGTLANGASLPDGGYFWISYDFRSSKGTENMFRDPIDMHPSGGEMIFSLPNGMQGYFVADGKGRRVDAAPTEIVVDENASDKIVVNGLGCIRCHDRGMKPFTDAVRPAVQLLPDRPGFDRRQVLNLYRGDAVLGKRRDQDGQRFLKATKELLGKLPPSSPLTRVSQGFLDSPLKLADASAELGLRDHKGLEAVFRLPQFSIMGLTAENMRRDMWEDYFDQVVRLQGLGTPIVPLDSQVKTDFTPTPAPYQVEFRSNKKNNSFEVGDQMSFVVTNKSAKNLFVELVATSITGRKVVVMTPTLLKAGQELRFPPAGQAIEVRGQLGKEHYTLFASEQKFPAGQVLRGKDVTDRIIHPFYDLRRESTGRIEPVFDPTTLVKKTLEIETK